jgi:dGTP triphosphohydrolase
MSLTVLDSLNNIIDLIKKGTTISIIKSKIQNLKEQVNDSDMLNLLNEALEILGKEPYSYPKYQYKKNPYQPSKAPQKLVNELVKSITHRDPRMELPELWSNIATEIALVHDGKIEQPREEIEDPQVTKLFNESLQKLLNRKNEYKQKLSEVEELSNRKVELKNSKDNLAQFQKQLLIKCIDNIIQKGNE